VAEDEQLIEKARLLIQRERELFELRIKHDQIGVWMSIGQSLPELFSKRDGSLSRIWDNIRKQMVTKLRLQRVLVCELRGEALEAVSPATPARALTAAARAVLDGQPSGFCNDPAAAEPGAGELAAALGLHRFMWARVAQAGGAPIFIAAGFDKDKAVFQSPFVSTDVVHFANAAQHIESLLGNAQLIRELESEKNQLHEANQGLEERDRALRRAAEELRAVNEGLEQRVVSRTRELAGKNAELRLVLDTVDQALLTVDLEGRLAHERSRVFDLWFGSYEGSPQFVEHVGAGRRFAGLFSLGLEALRDNILPRELCLHQLPQRLELGERRFDCRYLPIEDREELKGLLLAIDDVTERLKRAREDAEQRELLAAFTAVMRDRNGFLTFFAESERILADLDAATDVPAQLRLLHTLKGNAAIYGLQVIAELSHHAESELASEQSCAETVRQLRERWAAVVRTLNDVLPVQLQKTVEISEPQLDALAGRAAEGVSAQQIVAELRRMRWESSERHLGRLAQHAQGLASRLGKGRLEVDIQADGTRLEPEYWAPLWSELVHVVRNAVDHGIEAPDERRAAGKSEIGRVRLRTRYLGSSYVVDIEDDGRGIDWREIEQRCLALGRPARMRSDLLDALLSPGFTTRSNVTDTSGRGLGLAALAKTVGELSGNISVETELGRGTRWILTFADADAAFLAAADR